MPAKKKPAEQREKDARSLKFSSVSERYGRQEHVGEDEAPEGDYARGSVSHPGEEGGKRYLAPRARTK